MDSSSSHHYHPGAHDHSCGDSTIPHEELDRIKIYESADPNARVSSRKLGSVDFPSIRVKVLFDHYTKDKYMCSVAGQVVDPCTSRGSKACARTCDVADVVTPDLLQIARKRVVWAVEKTQSLVKLTTSRSAPISLTKAEFSNWDMYTEQLEKNAYSFEATDLVIIATLRKHNSNSVAGYAGCMKHDSNRRCIVGYFNYSPRIFNVKETLSPNVIEIERRTGLHEVFHVLGAVKLSNFHPSLSQDINLIPGNHTYVVHYNDILKKHTLHIQTPTVLKMWRQQTKCNTSEGPSMEDIPSGAGTSPKASSIYLFFQDFY